jgi:hypothetical protein
MAVAVPLRLGTLAEPVVGLVPISLDEADAYLAEWAHYLGPLDRPFRNDAWALDLNGTPISIATSSSIVGETSAGYPKSEAVELSRLCTQPGCEWATRVMLRLWREAAAPLWPCPAPRAGQSALAAVAYSKNDRHEGRIYRFDGWTKVTDRAGSSGGGTWSHKRRDSDEANGLKTLWLWRYPVAEAEQR